MRALSARFKADAELFRSLAMLIMLLMLTISWTLLRWLGSRVMTNAHTLNLEELRRNGKTYMIFGCYHIFVAPLAVLALRLNEPDCDATCFTDCSEVESVLLQTILGWMPSGFVIVGVWCILRGLQVCRFSSAHGYRQLDGEATGLEEEEEPDIDVPLGYAISCEAPPPTYLEALQSPTEASSAPAGLPAEEGDSERSFEDALDQMDDLEQNEGMQQDEGMVALQVQPLASVSSR